jgi:ubiquinone/menaquinone biosynthesis C-methylase UbiE
MELNNYDRTAFFYDQLSRAIFFRSQVNAQISQLHYVPAGSKVLIVGGGTGWVLEELAKIHKEGLEITYVEISGKMLAKAKKRFAGNNKMTFFHGGIEDFSTTEEFDIVQTAFLFDNFSAMRIKQVFERLDGLLNSGGLWLFSDFNYNKEKSALWQAIVLRLMYFLFRMLSNVEAKELTDMSPYFNGKGYSKLLQKHYYRNFIHSIIFKKPAKIPTFIPNLQP